MGLTGLFLVAFLVEHLHGNLKLYADSTGEAFDEYVRFLRSFGPLLTLGEIVLALLFLAHVYLAFRLTLENIQARSTRYVVRNNRGASSLGSVSMFYTGVLVLGYILKHLYDFRFQGRFFENPDALVKSTLSQPAHAIVYMGAAVILGVHLSHGFRSAFQSVGISNPRLNGLLEKLGLLAAILFAVGFASFPVYYLFRGNGDGS